jgi:integrase
LPGRKGKRVRARIIEQDLKLLQAVLNWGVMAKLLDKNPLHRFATPKEESPNRPVLTAEQFATVREQAVRMSNTAELFVCLLWFTGHRGASVRQLRWDDVDLAGASIRWRADVDKIGYEHRNPLDAELVPLLTQARAVADLIGDVWIFPYPRDAKEPMTRDDAADLWRSIADASGIKVGSRIGTHAFRRAFANRLRDVNLRDLKDLGGWKSAQTVVGTYLQPDQDAQRAALERSSGSRNG